MKISDTAKNYLTACGYALGVVVIPVGISLLAGDISNIAHNIINNTPVASAELVRNLLNIGVRVLIITVLTVASYKCLKNALLFIEIARYSKNPPALTGHRVRHIPVDASH
jgi:hypothetical protein